MSEELKVTAKKIGKGYKIFVTNKQCKYAVDIKTVAIIKRAVAAALRFEGIPSEAFPAEVSVSLVNDAYIKRLNKKFRDIDDSTDVLSFPLLEDGVPTPDDIDPDTGRIPIGDIVISVDHALRQARDYGHSFERELSFLCVHSVLHLLGYDHVTSDADEKIMFDRQDEILHSMGIDR